LGEMRWFTTYVLMLLFACVFCEMQDCTSATKELESSFRRKVQSASLPGSQNLGWHARAGASFPFLTA
jgi:hypothetical protein